MTFEGGDMRTFVQKWPNRYGVVTAIIVTGVIAGCRSVDPAVKRSEQTTDVLVDTRQSLVIGEQSVARSQDTLKTLRESKGDLRPAFALYMAELDAIRKEADRLKRESEVVRGQATLYCTARKHDISTISNDDMRRVAEQRTQRVREQCDDINERYARVNNAFGTYIRNLSDLQTYLANELNYGALDSGQRWFDEALTAGEMLRTHIRGLALQVELTSNILSPVPVATTHWPNAVQPPDAVAERP